MEHRKKMTAALSLFLVCVLLMLYTSYAWLVVSTAPEVSSIETNVGANGSLEIALLNDETFTDPGTIRTTVGDSLMSQDPLVSNTTWGNVIDLSPEEYGLQEISLRPSRLNVKADEEGTYTVGSNMLMVADFGTDGRVSFTSDNTVSGVFANRDFFFNSEHQTYGVRGVGVAEELSVRQKAFASAISLVPMYNASAIRSAQNIWRENGSVLMGMWERKSQHDGFDDFYTEPEYAAVRDIARKTLEAYDYVDKAIYNAMIGLASAELTAEDTFEWFYEMATKSDMTSYDLATMMPSSVLPDETLEYLAALVELKGYLQQYISYSEKLETVQDGSYYDPLSAEFLEYVGFWGSYLNKHQLYYEDRDAFANLREDNTLFLKEDTALSALARFTDNYSTSFAWGKRNVEVSTVQPMFHEYAPLIPYLSQKLNEIPVPEGPVQSDIFDLYGFAVDMAFRCNTTTDLLLQTEQALRVRETTETPVTQGGGSYVRFRSDDMDTEQLVTLVDTIRLGFLDNRGHLVALAKPNTSNYKEDIDTSITAPLYLYEFTVTSDGIIVPGERRSEDARILPLTQSSPEHLTAILWMDGDYVDNRMVSFISKDMTGVVNLQFASSVDLNPAAIPIMETE